MSDISLTQENISQINDTARQTAWRFKILKARGKYVAKDNPTITKIKKGGGTGYKYSTSTADYLQIIQDVYKSRNRTIILHNVAVSHVTEKVVTMIDHNTGLIYEANRNNADGWPTTYSSQPDHMLFDQESNYLYVSVPGDGSDTPCILKIDMNVYGDELNNCCFLDTSTDFLKTTVLTTTVKQTKYWGRMCLLAVRNNRLWVYYDYNQADFGTATGKPCFFGYYDLTSNNLDILWSWGVAQTGINLEEKVKTPARPVPGDYSTGYGKPQAWYYNEDNGHVTMAFSPLHPEYGHEALIAEFSLDEERDNTDLSFYQYSVTMSKTPTEVKPGDFRWLVCDLANVSISGAGNLDMKNGGYFEVIAEFDRNNGATLYVQTSKAMTKMGYGTRVGWEGISTCVMQLDPQDDVIWFRLGHIDVPGNHVSAFTGDTVNVTIKVRPYPNGLIAVRSVLDPDPLKQTADTNIPESELTYCSSLAKKVYDEKDLGDTEYTVITDIVKCRNFYYAAVEDEGGNPLGLWRIRDDGKEIVRYTEATSDLHSDYVRALWAINGESFILLSGKGAAPSPPGGKIQYYNGETLEFGWGGDSVSFDPATSSPPLDLAFGGDITVCCTQNEIQMFQPESTENEHVRSPKIWWDGTSADVILYNNSVSQSLDGMGRNAGFEAVSFTHSKGEASYQLTFAVTDRDYLPWRETKFNENSGAPGTYNGTLEDGTRILVERGILDTSGSMLWYPECQVFVVSTPIDATEGVVTMNVTAKGIIATFLSRAIYEYTHRPDEQIVTGGTLTSDDGGLTWHYETGGTQIYDWATTPEPIVYVDGTVATAYTLNTAAGTVTFYDIITGTVTADFTYYVPGTNDAEDIIWCILKHANELGGAGLDDTCFTRNILGETLTTSDNLTYSFSKNNIRTGDHYNAIYRNGTPVYYWSGGIEWNLLGITWDEKNGTVTFPSSQAGYTITGNCTYYTIQKTGVTLREIEFSPRTHPTAYDCINEVCRRVAPNYILHEDPDGKIVCDYYTQKPAGSEDYVITDDDIIISSASQDPIHYDLASYVRSYGRAPLSELPNLCYAKTVTNLWAYAWHAGTDFQTIVDGNPATQATGGYGRWSEGTYTVQAALEAAGEDGLPLISIDLEAEYFVETIILARGSQAANEGDRGAVCIYSVWISSDGLNWTRLINQFHIPPGQNVEFKAGTNYDKGIKFQYIKIHLHSLGLYDHKGNTDSQFGISEVQCYESEFIYGEAKLQDDNPNDENFDEWGLIKRYDGYLVHVARNGQPDEALYTQAKVDDDAQHVLDEMKRLMSQCQIVSPYLPGIPIFKTVKVINGAMERTVTFFIEGKTITPEGDTFTGTDYP